VRIGIVNDVMLATAALRRVVAATPGCTVAWTAANGAEAVDKAAADPVDLILMDLIMPVMDGVEATRRIMQGSPCAILIVTSTVTGHLDMVYDAMSLGALDAIQTPSLGLSGAIDGARPLQDKIAIVTKLLRPAGRATANGTAQAALPEEPPLIAIGSSTGGPQAVSEIIQAFPAALPAAVVIVQHVDEHFAAGLAEWLTRRCSRPVRPAREGDRLTAGQIVIAAGPDHLVIGAGGRLTYTAEPRDSSYKPSVDAFFQSAARRRGLKGCGVLLTGMGRDGADGLLAMRKAGFHTIAQDRQTSVVWGMPKAAAEIGAAIDVLPISAIGPRAVAAIKELSA
jgi:two-component system response regulator WspF